MTNPTLDRLTAAAPRRVKAVEINGVALELRELTLNDRLDYHKAIKADASMSVPFVLQRGVFDSEHGAPVFTTVEDTRKIGTQFQQDLAFGVLRLSGMLSDAGND